MAYFDNFENVLYDFSINTDRTEERNIVMDVMKRFTLHIDAKDILTFTEPYLIQVGETAEVIAYRLYGDMNLNWTIMFINGNFDVYSDWPMAYEQVVEYSKVKYGEDNLNKIHHWERVPEMMEVGMVVYDGDVLDTAKSGLVFWPNNMCQYADKEDNLQDMFEIATYTNLEHEIRENELKRYIRVIRPQFIAEFIKLYGDSAING